jgi:DNA-nicking Smr family endonuclease
MTRRRKQASDAGDDIDADLRASDEDIDADLRASDEDIHAELRTGPGDPERAVDAVEAALTDELDLHTFLPRECADVVAEYVRAAQEAGMLAVRIVHGKGTGTLRRIVHGVLDRHPAVRSFRLADERSGSWGATLVELHPRAG